MDVLLVDPLVPEALVWLQERHDVVYQPELADDPVALRRALAEARAVVLPRATRAVRAVMCRVFMGSPCGMRCGSINRACTVGRAADGRHSHGYAPCCVELRSVVFAHQRGAVLEQFFRLFDQ